MKNKELMAESPCTLRLVLESDTDAAAEEERVIKISADASLRELGMQIMEAYGWKNDHYHAFMLPKEVFRKLSGSSFGEWKRLCGIYLRFPVEDYDNPYWKAEALVHNDWEKIYLDDQREADRFAEIFPAIETKEGSIDISQASVEQIEEKICFGCGFDELIEERSIADYLLMPGTKADWETVLQEACWQRIYPVSDTLYFNYDYSKGLRVRISWADR